MTADSWARIVAGEEAAIYAYEVLTAELAGEKRAAGMDAILAHRQARDTARARLLEEGESPSSPASYDLPFPVNSESTAVALAVTVELRLVDQYLSHVEETAGAERRYASESAQEGTIRATRWGWETAAFPGGSSAPVVPGESATSPPSPSGTDGTSSPASPQEPSPPPAQDSAPLPQGDGATLQ